ncbi:cell division cycle protein 123 homolog [Impatiens glandulifera]|uniref:cell division cycle protein 123 homolog n=1 Tax=Impatiens glandulifera TaxID=253017 RepID=UPI001FB105AE|nr:cell division cycle protein 123 homolog [Impatiens glandulifera]XP_047307124.1 cell division cycle protein 123 homolog [Impatiens glandulifera]XP_047307125.1 cell division cycle protein 123 homolog [Impatiens glandulifera]XP_047307126.1 cell division cycle protein 123 homolog [Impatiens glandulifera]XP_047307127.1 cell division cycle protein 123 homolog [Impatiens glandulifera]XP_047307128.1 cell division cycle protein 123 homolog [Impatiens glandulifera]XP_047307129.1 cell division cycle 
MQAEEINSFQIQEWYPKFKSVSIKTLIHQLPESFVEYLLDDSGLFLLPHSNEDALPRRIHKPEDEEDFILIEDSEEEEEHSALSFPDLELQVTNSINSLGGAVFPKLNWSAPKDSAWISSSRTLKCTSFSEVALLLRSSESLTHDLCHAYDSCTDKTSSRPSNFYLALRKWYPSLLPEMEFRCFVHGGVLNAISQREVTTFYPALLEKKAGIEILIKEFFADKVEKKFELKNYTFDVYVTKNDQVKLIDFNPWGFFTLPLMFEWMELEEDIKKDVNSFQFRIVMGRCGVRPGLSTAVPYDYLDTSSGSGWDQFMNNAKEEEMKLPRSFDEP